MQKIKKETECVLGEQQGSSIVGSMFLRMTNNMRFMWLRIGASGGFLWILWWTFRLYKRQGILFV